MEELSTIRVGNLGIPLPINSLELHHTQRQQDEIQGELIQWQWVDKTKNVDNWMLRFFPRPPEF